MRPRRAIGRLSSTTALDRTAQVLPVPLGRLAPVRRQSSTLWRGCRRYESAALLAIAAVATGGALWLSVAPRSFTVEMNATEVRVDDVVLTASVVQSMHGIRVFTGPASLALAAVKSGTMRGGAVMTWKGVVSTGRCVLHVVAASASESCHFKSGAAEWTSIDTFDFASRVWHRHYEDGVDITITVPGGGEVIPIPFPLGR
jgi:hypothetical protein